MPDDITDEFLNADLGDLRRSQRLCKVASALAKSPCSSIAAACGGWSETMAAYRLLNTSDFTADDLIAPHRSKMTQRCAGHRCIVVAQDTTEFDFTHMKEAKGLGPLNDESRRGFYMHSLYAVSEQGLPLGLLEAKIVMRTDEEFRSASTRKMTPIEEKESFRWVEGYRKTSELARAVPECEVFSVSDREGDIFEVFAAWQDIQEEGGAEWIIRANQDRVLTSGSDEEKAMLFTTMKSAPLLGEIEFAIPARKGLKKIKGYWQMCSRSSRTVRQSVRAMKVSPRVPYRKGRKLKEVSFWAVLAEEIDPPEGEPPIRWLLLTSKELTTFEDAKRIINLYLRRWDIEVFHRVLKTGCRVERIQMMNGQALIHAIMIYSVIAWRILYLTHLGRQCPDIPCGSVFEETEWKSACAVVKRSKSAGEPTLSEFIRIIGKLGGHLGRKGDGMPGPQCIWQGLARVRDFAIAWQVFSEQ
jgi:hypothetical protein